MLCVSNSFVVFHQGIQTLKNNKTLNLSAPVFSCLYTLMKQSNSLLTYNLKHHSDPPIFFDVKKVDLPFCSEAFHY